MLGDVDKPGSDAVTRKSATHDAPIFVTGFARSGTTWVNRLMADYFDAGFVNEGQFIVSFGKHIKRYGDLKDIQNREGLLQDLARDDFFSILRRSYGIEMDWVRVKDRGASFAGVVRDVLTQIAERLGKRRIGSKYPAFGRHLELLNNLFPDCRVIHVVRDGRDCALSQKGVTWGHQNTYAAAIHWRKYLATVRNSADAMHGRFLEIRYEDLLLKPEFTMNKLDVFIGDDQGGRASRRFLENRGSLKASKVGQWRKAMPVRSQALFESVAGDMLELYGYPLTGAYRPPSLLFRAGYTIHDRLSREGWYWARKMFNNISEFKQ